MSSQAVENDYVGSPCGQLDQIMIYFAKADMVKNNTKQNKTPPNSISTRWYQCII